jgi:hypothetical protein
MFFYYIISYPINYKMSSKKEKQCICNKTIFEKKCKVCNIIENVELSKEDVKNNECPKHIQITCCGQPYYVCKKCTSDGWINTYGDGSKGRNYNIFTDECRYYD